MLRFIETEYNQLMFFLSMLCPGGESEVKPFSVYPKTSAAEYNQLSKLTHTFSVSWINLYAEIVLLLLFSWVVKIVRVLEYLILWYGRCRGSKSTFFNDGGMNQRKPMMMMISSLLVLLLRGWRERNARRNFVDRCQVGITSRGTF
jgi:hypothetical protein